MEVINESKEQNYNCIEQSKKLFVSEENLMILHKLFLKNENDLTPEEITVLNQVKAILQDS
ncbi:hypothetical protein [Brevibacillus laterosporus]|uniref:Uncharacterized protein n=1 Tax=Brevibacillus laterosporus TaxID=1465 RepID=A0AAP8QFZ3_BRELA|nr:hypothetical protein [Brevibacillus laterosporus]PPB10869.1 hypothetical protein C4A77_04375 [Brevibacillus laterosporus]